MSGHSLFIKVLTYYVAIALSGARLRGVEPVGTVAILNTDQFGARTFWDGCISSTYLFFSEFQSELEPGVKRAFLFLYVVIFIVDHVYFFLEALVAAPVCQLFLIVRVLVSYPDPESIIIPDSHSTYF